jgi:hypothetical protein
MVEITIRDENDRVKVFSNTTMEYVFEGTLLKWSEWMADRERHHSVTPLSEPDEYIAEYEEAGRFLTPAEARPYVTPVAEIDIDEDGNASTRMLVDEDELRAMEKQAGSEVDDQEDDSK